MPDGYTIGDIVAKTGAKERQVLLWAEALALWPEGGNQRTGRGVHRRFAWTEVEVAAVLVAIAPFRLPIGVMAHIASVVRMQLWMPKGGPEILDRMAEAVTAARAGESGICLVISPGNDVQPSEPFSVHVRWPAASPETADPAAPPHKAGFVVDLAECWRGLNP